jgi:hypothetical protein
MVNINNIINIDDIIRKEIFYIQESLASQDSLYTFLAV